MSPIEGFFVVDSENSLVGDKPEVENAAKKRLGDISNVPQQPKPLIQLDKEQFVSSIIKEHIYQLQKENSTLMELLADRNKLVEFSGIELQKLSVSLQKLQRQNLQLAQANSQMLADLNSGKDRLKELRHELGCKNGLLKAKEMELEEKAKTKTCQKMNHQVGTSKSEEARETSEADKAEIKPCNIKRKKQSKSLSHCTVKQIQLKETNEYKSGCSRRQSARFKSEEPESTDVLEMDNVKFAVCPRQDDRMHEDCLISMASSVKKDDNEGHGGSIDGGQELRRLSIGRPLRVAAKRVQSYKETPLNVKMRRPE